MQGARWTLLASIVQVTILYAYANHYDYFPRFLAMKSEEPIDKVKIDDLPSNLSFNPPLLSSFKEITDRPLFSPSRRPDSPSSTISISAYAVRGVLLSRRRNVALVESRPHGTVIRVSEGDVIAGWQIVFINANEIGLSSTSSFHTMKILPDGGTNLPKSVSEEPTETAFGGEPYQAKRRQYTEKDGFDLDELSEDEVNQWLDHRPRPEAVWMAPGSQEKS